MKTQSDSNLNVAPLMTSQQTADLLSVSLPTVKRLTLDPRNPLPSVKLRHSVRFQLEKVQDWIEKQSR